MIGSYKKINEAEVVVWVVFLLGLYVLNDVLDGLAIGLFIAPVLNAAATGGMRHFFERRGDKTASNAKSLTAQFIGGFIPFVPEPIIAFGIKVYKHNHQNSSPVPEKTTVKVYKYSRSKSAPESEGTPSMA